jgi:diacylglycerol kinase family enzyme
LNPRAGTKARYAQANQYVDSLQQTGYRAEVITDLKTLATRASELQKAGDLRTVLAVGGDGTASIVRSHVPLEIPLLIVPMGTENLLGRYLRQSIEPGAVLAVVENGVVVELDLCQANGQKFLSVMSAGFDAAVVRSLHENRRGNIRRAAYIGPMLHAIRSYDYPPMRIYWGGAGGEPTICRWLFAFNLPLYALGLQIAPDAVGTDGMLDVCSFERGSTWSVARYLWHIVRRIHLNLPDAGLRQTRRFRIESIDGIQVAYQLDGDFAGVLPVEVEVLPRQLKLLVSPEAAGRLGFNIGHTSRP